MEETVRVPSAGTSDRTNLPSMSVAAPTVVPFTITPAPITGEPVSSVTTPDIDRFWACSAMAGRSKDTEAMMIVLMFGFCIRLKVISVYPNIFSFYTSKFYIF